MIIKKTESDVSLNRLKWRIMVRGDLQNKNLLGDNWSPPGSMRTLKYIFVDAVKHNTILH